MPDIFETILHRRSIRRFQPKQIEEAALQQIIQAGLYAPSAGGRQGVIFAVCHPACHGRAAPAECQQLTFAALFKFCVVPVLFHLAYPDIRQPVGEHIGDLAVLYPAAGIHIPGGEDRQVAVAAVAAAVDHTVLHGFGDFARPGFVLIQRPQVIFLVEVGLAPCGSEYTTPVIKI